MLAKPFYRCATSAIIGDLKVLFHSGDVVVRNQKISDFLVVDL
jgi:hypothetical protein